MNDFIYRKKPVVIEAIRLKDLDSHHTIAIPYWLTDAIRSGVVEIKAYATYIHTLEGTMTVGDDDYIIRGIKGELYACKPDIFEATYEKVT